jgi:hypothetical protein
VDHGSFEPKHDADASDDADATVMVRRRDCALPRIHSFNSKVSVGTTQRSIATMASA